MSEADAVTAERHRERARLLMETNRSGLAETELRAALAIDPQDPLTLTDLAWCLKNLSREKEGLSLARSASGIAPDLPAAHLTVACCLMKLGRTREAWVALRTTLRLDPQNLQAHLIAIQMHLSARSWSACVKACDRALALAPQEATVHGMRSLALFNLGHNEQAIVSARQAISCDPDAALSHNAIGLSHLDQKDYRAAADAFREALRLNPDDPCAQMLLLLALKHGSSAVVRAGSRLTQVLAYFMVFGLPLLLLFACMCSPASVTWRVIGIVLVALMLLPLLTSVMGNLLVARTTIGRHLLGPLMLTTSWIPCVMATMAMIKAAISLKTGEWMLAPMLMAIACTPAHVVIASEPGWFQRISLGILCLSALMATVIGWMPTSPAVEIATVILAWLQIIWLIAGLNLSQHLGNDQHRSR